MSMWAILKGRGLHKMRIEPKASVSGGYSGYASEGRRHGQQNDVRAVAVEESSANSVQL